MAPGTSIGPYHAIMVMVALGLSGGIMIHLLRGGTVETTRFATARLPMVTTENRDIAEIMAPLRHPGTWKGDIGVTPTEAMTEEWRAVGFLADIALTH